MFWVSCQPRETFLCNCNSLEKKELGIGIGNALKRYNSLGSTVIFRIAALPNHKNNLGVHFWKSLEMDFSKGVKFAAKRDSMLDVNLITSI